MQQKIMDCCLVDSSTTTATLTLNPENPKEQRGALPLGRGRGAVALTRGMGACAQCAGAPEGERAAAQPGDSLPCGARLL